MERRKTKDPWNRWLRGGLKGSHLHEPSQGTLRGVIALGSQLPEKKAPPWWAVLVFDSAAEPIPVGVRSAGIAERRLLYQLHARAGAEEACQVDLRIRREPRGTVEVTGQLLPPWKDARVEATVARTRRKQQLGEAGEFLFRGLPARAPSLRIEIQGGQARLEIREVPLLPPQEEGL